jgi:membrane protease YdiL (CAAX protease family)
MTPMSQTVFIPAADRPIRGLDVLSAALAAIGINFIAGGVIVAATVAIWMAQHLPGSPLLLFTTNFYAIVGITTVTNALILVALMIIAKRFTTHPIGYFFPPVLRASIVRAAASAAALMLAGVAIETALKYGLGISMAVSPAEEAMSPKSWSQLGIVLVCFAAFVPFYEEYLFRGFVFGWLKRVTPVWLAIIISAALFAAVHGLFVTRGGISGWVGTGEIFAIGCLLAWWTQRTNSLWPAYTVHLVNNAMAFTLSFLLPNWP